MVQKNKKQYILFGSLICVPLAGVKKLGNGPPKTPSPLVPHAYANALRVFI